MSKKVAFTRRPTTGAIDSWVAGQGVSPELPTPIVAEPVMQAPGGAPVLDVPIAPETPELPKRVEVQAPQVTAPPVEAEELKMKRLTIDIPDALHRRVKSRCGQDGVKMADVIRGLLETRFPES